ncbi:MAG: hypothetical protein NTV05_04545 [Acidobacteria bacterium]|nr:hypothetical protein [Acidobacteriota bacterium]
MREAGSAGQVTRRDERELNDSTIDNGSTHTQLRYLARVFDQTKQARFRDAFDSGLAYLVAAQYKNGGWPQYYPLRTNYSRCITFNDNAMIGVMRLLREIGESRAPFGFVDDATRVRVRTVGTSSPRPTRRRRRSGRGSTRLGRTAPSTPDATGLSSSA